MNEQQLYHFGIKGMRWGVRRTRAQLGHETEKHLMPKVKEYVSGKVKEKTRKKSPSSMTDEELRQQINRLGMEKQYRQYIAELNPKKEHKVRKLVGEILSSGAKTIAAKGFDKLGNSIFNKKKDETVNIDIDPTKVSTKTIKKKDETVNIDIDPTKVSTNTIKKVNEYLAFSKKYRELIFEEKIQRQGDKDMKAVQEWLGWADEHKDRNDNGERFVHK